MPAAQRTPRRSIPDAGTTWVAMFVIAGAVSGCPAHIIPNAPIVREVNFRGVRQVDEDSLRSRLALRESPMFFSTRPRWLRWWRWWWEDPEYFDETALVRDRLRILRYLQARGFYDARVETPAITENGLERTINFTLTEGEPTIVADVRLRGCEAGHPRVLPEGGCRVVREHMDLRIGGRFDESTFAHDRDQVIDFTRDAGFATPTVLSRAIVDPAQHLAWVEYTIRPGPPSRFGRVRLLMTPSRDPVVGDELPNGLPVRPVLSAINIEPGAPYNRVLLARAQQALFDLGVFGIARIEEVPRGDGVVDLNAILSPTRLWRLRVGLGAHADTTITNVHALVSFTHRNFLGGMRRLRVDVQPKVFFSSLLSPYLDLRSELELRVHRPASRPPRRSSSPRWRRTPRASQAVTLRPRPRSAQPPGRLPPGVAHRRRPRGAHLAPGHGLVLHPHHQRLVPHLSEHLAGRAERHGHRRRSPPPAAVLRPQLRALRTGLHVGPARQPRDAAARHRCSR